MTEDGSVDTPGRDRVLGRRLVVSVVLVVWGLITHGTYAGTGDAPHYLMIAHSLAFSGDLDLADDYREATLIAEGTLEPGNHARLRDGRLRPVHDVGMPLVFAPVYRVAYGAANWLGDAAPPDVLRSLRLNKALLLRHQISLVMAFLTGLLAREMYFVLRQMAASRSFAFWSALLFATTPPILSHAFVFFTEIPTALLAIWSFRMLTMRSRRTPWTAGLLGVATGLLLLIHARNIGLLAGICSIVALDVVRRECPRRLLWVFMASVAGVLAVRVAVTHALWGQYLFTPHASPGDVTSMTAMSLEAFTRMSGLLIDREHGLLAYAPIYALALPGLLLMMRRPDRTSRNLLLLVGGYLLPIVWTVTNVHGWSGGWSPAARFLVPVAPLLWLAATEYGRRGLRAVTAGLVVVQTVMNAFLWQHPRLLWNDGDGLSAFGATGWLPSWPGGSPASTFLLATLGLVVAGFGLAALVRHGEAASRRTALSSPP